MRGFCVLAGEEGKLLQNSDDFGVYSLLDFI
jgi:hypothetical protein